MAQANNIITIIGRVGSDPEMKYIDSNKVVASFNVAVNRTQKDSDGNYITDWFSCQFWGKSAELVGDYVKKGTLLSVVGSIRVDKWEKDGEKRSKFYIHGDNFQLLSSKNEGGSSGDSHKPAAKSSKSSDDDFMEDDIPPF